MNTTHRSDTGLAATRLRLTDIPGTTQVKVGTTTTMALELSGPESLIQGISWKVRGDTLHVTGPAGGGSGTMISSFGPGGSRMSIRGGRGIVIGDGDVVISGRGGQVIVDGKVVSGPGSGQAAETGEIRLTVFVPAGTPIQIADGGDGSYEVGDVRGTLDLKIEGFSQIRAGAMAATRISVGGSADIEITSVQDALRAGISGSGRITVSAGEVSQLNLSVSGSGRIAYAGTANDADLNVSGSGRIRVDTVTGSLRKDVSGSGSIDVRVQPRRSADDFWH